MVTCLQETKSSKTTNRRQSAVSSILSWSITLSNSSPYCHHSVPVTNCHVHKLLVIYALDFDWSSVLIRRGIRRFRLLCEDKIICFQIESFIGDEVQYYVITRSIHLFSLFQDARWKQLLSSFITVTILEAILDSDVTAWMVK
jgi:hypothetical protein